MKAVWLSSTYYLDDAVGQLSGNAERMLTRALAYCGSAESSGFVSERAIRMLGLPNPKKLVRELIDANILIPRADGSGWDFRSWTAWNEAGDKLIARQKADRERQARHRAAKQGNSRDGSRDTTGAADTKNHSYSSVDREKNRDKRDPIESGSNVNRDADITPEQRKRVSPSRNMSRDVTAPEESREEKNSGYVPEEPTDSNGRSSVAATPGADLIREHIDRSHPDATKTALRLQASELLRSGTEPEIVAAALQLWNTKPGIGNGRTILASLCSEVIKTRAAPIAANGRKPAASDAAFAATQALKRNPSPTRLEIES